MSDLVDGTRLFKVAYPTGAPCHGGSNDFRWPLPTDTKMGAWVEVSGALAYCDHPGLHLTTDPARLLAYQGGNPEVLACFEAEYDGERRDGDTGSHKISVRKARLLRVVAWEDVRVVHAGHHVARSGHWLASGSASVEASGSASVEASGSASVLASGSASVRAYGSASVLASGSASVLASGSASVEASGSASVEAYDSASVRASDSASVRASGSASVRAYGSATVISTRYHSDSAVVALAQMAAHVDRRGDRLVLRSPSDEAQS